MSTDNCFVTNEWDTLKKVVVGSATSWGPTPSAEEAVDPKSRDLMFKENWMPLLKS